LADIMKMKATENAYETRWQSLAKKASIEIFGEAWDDVSPLFMAKWLSGCRHELGSSSYRVYKAAVIWRSEQDDRLDDSQREYVRTRLDTVYLYCGPLRDRPEKLATSAQALKHIKLLDWIKLTEALTLNRSVYDAPLLAYLEAGRRAGLRPSEWAKARLLHCAKSKRCMLVVRNRKDTNGRSHGAFRRLVWNRASAEVDIIPIRAFLEVVDGQLRGAPLEDRADRWKTFCRAMQDRLRNLSRALWPRRKRHPCLYTARHMFAAVAKAENSKIEIAALMGHAVDETATKHYARPSKGRKGLPPVTIPTAHPRDVARVRSVAKPDWLLKKIESENVGEDQPDDGGEELRPRKF
jgi:hypothetical protein